MPNDDRVVALLEELVTWSRFTARDSLTALLREVLADPKHAAAYDLTDGTHTQKEVGDAIGLSQPTVSALWQKWRRLGILQENGGRSKHLASLSDLGLELPSVASAKSRARKKAGKAASGISVDE